MRLTEFGDLNWVPHIYHYYLRIYSLFFIRFIGYDKMWAKQTEAFLKRVKAKSVIEYGSGSGEPLLRTVSKIKSPALKSLNYTMSDLRPLPEFVDKVNNHLPENFSYIKEPVDASTHRPQKGQAVVFINSFHHLPPETAKRVIKNNLENGNEMLILEYVRNSFLAHVSMVFGPLIVMLTVPFVVKLKHLPIAILFTYLIPIFPLMLLWDGLVSGLSAYNEKFFRNAIEDLNCHAEVSTNIERSLLYPSGTVTTSITLKG